MNTLVLNEIMKRNNIPSYYSLANKSEIPYTSLLDLVHGRSNNLESIKLLGDFFEIPYFILLKDKPYTILLDEENKLTSNLLLEDNTSSFCSLLLSDVLI